MVFSVEKWMPDGGGRLKCDYGYTVVDYKVCYCCCEDFPVYERLDFGGYVDPNLPVPFHAGRSEERRVGKECGS